MLIQEKIPNIGDYTNIPVIEINVAPGDEVEIEQCLITLESDKATIEIPATKAGIVRELKLKIGDLVTEGSTVLLLEPHQIENKATDNLAHITSSEITAIDSVPQPFFAPSATESIAAKSNEQNSNSDKNTTLAQNSSKHAGPAVRKLARELGANLNEIEGTGLNERVTNIDVQHFIKNIISNKDQPLKNASTHNFSKSKIDFNKWGSITSEPLSRIKKLSAVNLTRNWTTIPAVTYHEHADITKLESFRVNLNKEFEKENIKITILSFLIKATATALVKFPQFNASLDGENLILKKYTNIGFAADTPQGLLVPVIYDVDRKGIKQISQELSNLANLARTGKLRGEQMNGACFTISSVGGLGGTGFSPIINAPELAILGVSKTAFQPVWQPAESKFMPRLILPLSLSADHRVIDGAQATRFNAFIAELLTDFRRIVL